MDIRDRKIDSLSVRNSLKGEWMFRSLVESLDRYVYVLDNASRYVAVNNAFCCWMKRERKDIVGRAVTECWPFGDGIRDTLEDEDVRLGERIDKEEQWLRNGRLCRLRIRKYPVRDDDDAVCGVLSMFRELSVIAAPTPVDLAIVPSRLTARKTILAVDANVEVLRLLTRILSVRGFHVRALRDGRQAVKFYRENPDEVDLVLLDQILAGQSGMATIEQLMDLNPHLPVVLLCGSGQSETGWPTNAPKLVVVNKPFDPEHLARCVENSFAEALRKE
jgi:CheY-like chemotaxis protein